jgi:mannose-1-phosphate guanylyltransferase / mannose-6-phosphate isomerase
VNGVDIMVKDLVAVILAGGSGTRLWPVSRTSYPKQFCKLINDRSLLQETIIRAVTVSCCKDIIIVTNEEYYFFCKDQVAELNLSCDISLHYILEPCGKNTAPALAIAAQYSLDKISPESKLFVLPSDHSMECNVNFTETVREGASLAAENKLILFAIKPTSPETGYGYIKKGEQFSGSAFLVDSFVEKPDLKTAQKYLQLGNYYWNSGMFLFAADFYLTEMERHSQLIFKAAMHAYNESDKNQNDFFRIDASYSDSPSSSIDYELMERTKNTALFIVDNSWSDLGCWASLSKIMAADVEGNVLEGDVCARECENSLIMSSGPKLVALGLRNKIVVSTQDSVLVADKSCAQEVKTIVEELKNNEEKVASEHNKIFRPWGSYETLAKSGPYHAKLIVVNPGASLSLQMHQHRSEHWVVVSGTAEVVSGESKFTLSANQSTYIPKQTKHRLSNLSKDQPLSIIEVQLGDYLGEDDIVRFDDIYGRS